MYILGDADCYAQVDMWGQVIDLLKAEDNFGRALALCCPRHPDTAINISEPDDFARFSPEGGCNKRCGDRLACGHSCSNKCHAPQLHKVARCLSPCPRIHPCGHSCPKLCGDGCGQCKSLVHDVKLDCGHIMETMQCCDAEDLTFFDCPHLVRMVMPGCEHEVKVKCHQLHELDNAQVACMARCEASSPCGHQCEGICHNCNRKVEGNIVEVKHQRCTKKCDTPYSNCRHACKELCHRGISDCKPCEKRCELRCAHSQCAKTCTEPCAPCSEVCNAGCEHQGRCQMPCTVPCNILPCSKRCEKTLSCGHRCPSICGELCPSSTHCQTCCKEKVKGQMVDYITCVTYGEIDVDKEPCIFPRCGHIMTVESMDGHMGMQEYYEFDAEGSITGLKGPLQYFTGSDIKSCPTCRYPLREVQRYNRIVRKTLLEENTKKFISWSKDQYVHLAKELEAVELDLKR